MAMKLFELLGTITVENKQALDQLDETSKGVEGVHSKFRDGLQKAASWGLTVASKAQIAAAGIARSINNIVNNTILKADEIDKSSQRLGLSMQAFQEYQYVLGQNGMDIENLEEGFSTLRERMDEAADPNSDAAKLFNKIGVSAREADGDLRNIEEVFNEVLLAFTAMQEGTQKELDAKYLFGDSAGTNLLPTLNKAGTEIKELINQAHEFGLILSDEDIAAGVKLGDTIETTSQAFSTFATEFGVALMPAFQTFYDFLLNDLYPVLKNMFAEDVLPELEKAVNWATGAFDWFIANGGSIETILKNIGDAIVVAYGATHPWAAALLVAAETIDRITGGNKDETVEDITVKDHVYNALVPGAGVAQLSNAFINSAKNQASTEGETEEQTKEQTYVESVYSGEEPKLYNIWDKEWWDMLLNKDPEKDGFGGSGGSFGGSGGKFGEGIKTTDDFIGPPSIIDALTGLPSSNNSVQLESAINKLIGAIDTFNASAANLSVQGSVNLDSGALVGHLLPKIDAGFGRIVGIKSRG